MTDMIDAARTTAARWKRQDGRASLAVAQDVVLRFGTVWLLIAMALGAQVVYPGFLAWGNIQNVLAQNSQVGIVAVGMTLVMIAGGFDLSAGAVYAGASVFFAEFAHAMPVPLALSLVVVIGMAAGAVNGALITRVKVNPFVATLGTSSVFSGLAFLHSHSAPVLNDDPGFGWLGQSDLAGLPVCVWLAVVVFVAGGVTLSRTVYGRSLYAVGGNSEASRLAGLRVDLLRASTYVAVGGCAALGGCIAASRLSVGQADIGASISLEAIAAVVIGGTSLLGGEGAVWRTAVGLLVIAFITNVCESRGLDINVESVLTGVIIIGAVGLDACTRSRRG
jgi:ribose transport system permease protein